MLLYKSCCCCYCCCCCCCCCCFVVDSNRGWSGTNFTNLNSTVKFADSDNPYLVQEWGHISHTSRLIVNFLSKFSNFRGHSNSGWSGTNFNNTVKFADPDNPLLGAGMGGRISRTSRVIANFLFQFSNFVAIATGVGLAQISPAQLNSPSPIIPK